MASPAQKYPPGRTAFSGTAAGNDVADSPPGFRGGNAPELTVSELAQSIRRTLEDGFGHVRLKGEVSGYRGPHTSGHCYFALKDDSARIEAVIWKGVFGRLKFRPEEGMEVVAVGRVSAHPGTSKYQIVIEALEPSGAGALMALLEDRKRRLQAEGLFDAARKRKLPFMPRVVGIVTSPTGAVIRDMLAGFAERFPAHVVIWPVRVQGETCGPEVAAAIRGFNAIRPGGNVPRPDVLIVARGGGSLEDLWGFNDEAVARAAAESRIPIVSAVGHETDWTLIDLAADARAPTPTKAAEWVVPKHSELLEQVAELSGRLAVGIRRLGEHRRAELKAAARGLPRAEDLLRVPRQRFDTTEMRLGRALLANTRAHAMRHARIGGRLSPGLVSNRLARLEERLAAFSSRNRDGLARLAARQRARHEGAAGRLRPSSLSNRIGHGREHLTVVRARAGQAIGQYLQRTRDRLEARSGLLAALSYQGVLARGFAVIRNGNGETMRSASHVSAGDLMGIEFRDGEVRAQALENGRTAERESMKPSVTTRPKRPKAPGHGEGGPQGTLF